MHNTAEGKGIGSRGNYFSFLKHSFFQYWRSTDFLELLVILAWLNSHFLFLLDFYMLHTILSVLSSLREQQNSLSILQRNGPRCLPRQIRGKAEIIHIIAYVLSLQMKPPLLAVLENIILKHPLFSCLSEQSGGEILAD